mmetsp:Transcript_3816/g.9797  ORF Transcript_3816/g.9797 Transcript_3816/m.9797 type:complete len:183 (+) Transcript_3816:14-562(+)|eukprot:CAMPEP_0197421720 /NCGR_PEP_ID=MMETSP1170-20131217/10743_1 /TAXON_ID=54406 /ORGANISM="Sarcinochrysis sp, Strain CCMP770" /LENGTH=182 /DNA_ID=CAMNT_0042948991 /DNA_START=11 /DNA_END=559 /DNA_ORIENTATION=-
MAVALQGGVVDGVPQLLEAGDEAVALVVCAHGTPPPEFLEDVEFHDNLSSLPRPSSQAFVDLVATAAACFRTLVDAGYYVHVITSGGKRKWTDVLGVGDVLLRELVRELTIDSFSPAPGAKGTIEVEGLSKTVHDAARHTVARIRKKTVNHVTVVCAAAAEAADAFQLASTQCVVDVVDPAA